MAASSAPKLTATLREEKGKGAARRARRAGNVPAVIYGHGSDPQHLSVPARDFAAILRANGTNAVIDLDIDGKSQLALTKQVDVHPIKSYIEHADFLIVRRGEKVTVDVLIVVEGDAQSGSVVTQDANALQVEADALSIPEQIVVSVEGAVPGTMVHASDIELPAGVTLIAAPETLVVAVHEAKTAAEPEDEAAEGEEAAEAGEGAAEAASDESAE
ncbi:50S ribosomal protein L25 [Gordonia araii NBRC 100433]|uniref:Large ribosomal subunit protein bL25 n=1 Tax=Gordonia araii NBRC 100433 TaxID=1073574 RepID=G7H664_9ACTN|nr:50S ribosomal protein L25/general stress protein Ctc [Gordonia araii]NNG98701.1 50S ribosomal protein L25/general stress protein Ctc [Gordonia araii NBRC 100433]GAB11303.1 50S ribosomal protein L25 [Gordonia araii NBRC 100433]